MSDIDTMKQRLLRHDRAVPRYTSYPPAPIFTTDFSTAQHEAWLAALPAGAELSLYVHIPFCPQLCTFCGCFTHITGRYAPVEDYVHLMRREIQIMGNKLQRQQRVTHIHFGGGSPTMLHERDFLLLLQTLRSSFVVEETAEIAVEIDPRAVTNDMAAVYGKAGVNRISFGVQDFEDRVMRAVNRVQPFDVVYNARQKLRDAGIHACNLDFIYGLPHQTVRSLTRTMDYALLLKPERIALYGYAHVPWKKRNIRLVEESALPDPDLRYDLFAAAAKVLEEDGMVPLGIDHFARPTDPMAQIAAQGLLARNFQGYTDKLPHALIGFGMSAISQFPQGYAQNTIANETYEQAVMGTRLPLAKGYAFQGEDVARKAVIDMLMCHLTVDAGAIWQTHGHDTSTLTAALQQLQPLQADGLVQIDGTRLTVPLAARPIVRLIAAAFDAYLPPVTQEQRHARAV